MSFLNPGLWLAALLALGAAFGAGSWQGRGAVHADWNKAKLEQAEANRLAFAKYRNTERGWSDSVLAAVNRRTQNEKAHAADAAALDDELVGLRNDNAAWRSGAAAATCDAVRERESTLAVVFEQCTGRYSEVARDAQTHAADSLMLQEAWPR